MNGFITRYCDVLEFIFDPSGTISQTRCIICGNKPSWSGKGGYRHANTAHAQLVRSAAPIPQQLLVPPAEQPSSSSTTTSSDRNSSSSSGTGSSASSSRKRRRSVSSSSDRDDGSRPAGSASQPVGSEQQSPLTLEDEQPEPPSSPPWEGLLAEEREQETESDDEHSSSSRSSWSSWSSRGSGSSDSGGSSSSSSSSDDDDDDDDEGGSSSSAQQAGTGAYLRQHLDDPLYSHQDGDRAPPTMKQMLHWLFGWKRRYKIADSAFDKLLQQLADVGLPPSNILPRSLHLCRAALEVDDWRKYEVHLCAGDRCPGYVYSHMAAQDYPCHRSDRCPVCQEPRFKEVQRGHKLVLEPRWWMIQFPLDMVMQLFHSNPDWVAARDPPPTDAAALELLRDNGSFYGGSEMRRLAALRPEVLSAGSEMVELCLDWIAIFNTCTYSVGLLGIRSLTRHNSMRQKKANYKILGIIPGPSIPPNFRPYLLPVASALKSSPERPLEVVDLRRGPDGLIEVGAPYRLRLFLVGVHADTPARQKAAAWPGVAAILPCGFCKMQSERLPSASGKLHYYSTGYVLPVAQDSFDGVAMLAGDGRLTVSDDEQHERGRRVQVDPKQARTAGCVGLSVLPQLLQYVSYSGLWVQPVAHTFLYGLHGNLLAHVLRIPRKGKPVSALTAVGVADDAAKKTISARCSQVRLTSEFGRAVRDIIRYFGSLQLEGWLHLVETVAPFLFAPRADGSRVLPPLAEEAFSHLRAATLHYMRPPSAQHPFTQETRDEAAQHMKSYAALLWNNGFPRHLFTLLLHWATVHLPEQECRRGSTGCDLELWTERVMQEGKAAVGGRVQRGPEKTMANTLLQDIALGMQRLRDPSLPSFDSSSSSSGSSLRANEDAGDTEGNQLLGQGQRLSAAHAAKFLGKLQAFLPELPDGLRQYWSPTLLQTSFASKEPLTGVYSFARADRGNVEILDSALYMRTTHRLNHVVRVSYEEGEPAVLRPHVGEVQRFLWVRHPGGNTQHDLRVAFVSFFEPPCEQLMRRRLGTSWEAYGRQLLYVPTTKIASHEYPVLVSQIDTKLVTFVENEERFFSAFSNLSKLR